MNMTSQEAKNLHCFQIAHRMVKKDEFDKAIEMINMTSQEIKDSEEIVNVYWFKIVKIMIQKGRFDKIVEIIDVKSEKIKDLMYSYIAIKMAEKGQFNIAIDFANKMKDSKPEQEILHNEQEIFHYSKQQVLQYIAMFKLAT